MELEDTKSGSEESSLPLLKNINFRLIMGNSLVVEHLTLDQKTLVRFQVSQL